MNCIRPNFRNFAPVAINNCSFFYSQNEPTKSDICTFTCRMPQCISTNNCIQLPTNKFSKKKWKDYNYSTDRKFRFTISKEKLVTL